MISTIPECSTNTAPKGGGRLDYIDALRGLAALLVVLEHVGTKIALHPLAPKLISLVILGVNHIYLNPGRVGVVAFFMVSGFVIPFSFRGASPRINFVVTRFFRLYPAYWLSLALALLVFPLIGEGPFTTRQALANVTMMQSLFHQDNVIGAYWTLLIELIFYALCFAAFHLGLLGKARFDIAMVVGLLSMAMISAYWRHSGGGHGLLVGYVRFIGLMFFGTLLRRARLDGDPLAGRAVVPLVMFSFITGLVTYYFGTRPDESIMGNIMGETVGVALFFAALYIPFTPGSLFLFMGRISYSLYLLHAIFLYVFLNIFYASNFSLGSILFGIGVIGSSIGASALCFRLVETPSIALGKQISRRLQGRVGKLA